MVLKLHTLSPEPVSSDFFFRNEPESETILPRKGHTEKLPQIIISAITAGQFKVSPDRQIATNPSAIDKLLQTNNQLGRYLICQKSAKILIFTN